MLKKIISFYSAIFFILAFQGMLFASDQENPIFSGETPTIEEFSDYLEQYRKSDDAFIKNYADMMYYLGRISDSLMGIEAKDCYVKSHKTYLMLVNKELMYIIKTELNYYLMLQQFTIVPTKPFFLNLKTNFKYDQNLINNDIKALKLMREDVSDTDIKNIIDLSLSVGDRLSKIQNLMIEFIDSSYNN